VLGRHNTGNRKQAETSVAKKYLFVHQNFPAQFVHVAEALARQGNEVVALAIKGRAVPGVRLVRYTVTPLARVSALEAARDLETKILRGSACAQAMEALKRDGFMPDVVVAHPGWGEALFCKDVWPAARLVIYAEFFYGTEDSDYGFDKEMFQDTTAARARLRLKNTVHLHALSAADTIYSPTQWQRSKLPAEYREKTQVMFDGIDTAAVKPDPLAMVKLVRKQLTLTRKDEVITFVNRNLEPYRGFHVFMRALPEIMARRPKAHCLIVGRDAVSYGSPPRTGGLLARCAAERGGAPAAHRSCALSGRAALPRLPAGAAGVCLPCVPDLSVCAVVELPGGHERGLHAGSQRHRAGA
jgi:glycosyltransferase involved in cell wall biosynthesis